MLSDRSVRDNEAVRQFLFRFPFGEKLAYNALVKHETSHGILVASFSRPRMAYSAIHHGEIVG